MTLTTVSAYLTTNNAYQSIVIPSTDTCILNPTDEIIADFYSTYPDFTHWSGTSILDQLNPDLSPQRASEIAMMTEHDIASQFGLIIYTRFA
jgi:hypothetical protein